MVVDDVRSPVLGQRLGHAAEKLVEDLDMVSGVYPGFDRERWLKGEIAPVFFGSAINNFGVKELLDCFVDIAPPPGPVAAEEREVHPQEQKFTGFVFKIHANMDPRHRDRLAFLRIVSGSFQRNEAYYHVRLDRRFASPVRTLFWRTRRRSWTRPSPGTSSACLTAGISSWGIP